MSLEGADMTPAVDDVDRAAYILARTAWEIEELRLRLHANDVPTWQSNAAKAFRAELAAREGQLVQAAADVRAAAGAAYNYAAQLHTERESHPLRGPQ